MPAEVAEANDIRLVSLYVNFGAERTEREADIADFEVFYDELRSAEQLPTTSQPSVGDFVSVYEPLLAEGRDVVSIHIAGGLSGTPEAARQAKQTLERDGKGGDRVHVIDSSTAAGGLGLMVVAAAHRAASGADADAVVEAASEARDALKMWFSIDTLEFLKRGGRIGAASAWIGSTLKIKPILSVENEITPVERVRTSKRAFERMVDYARQRHASGADAWVVQHIQAPDQAELLAERCREIFGREPVFLSEIGPVLGAHTGPGLLGVGSIPDRFVA
jgi:DegV family protein with EDD domain